VSVRHNVPRLIHPLPLPPFFLFEHDRFTCTCTHHNVVLCPFVGHAVMARDVGFVDHEVVSTNASLVPPRQYHPSLSEERRRVASLHGHPFPWPPSTNPPIQFVVLLFAAQRFRHGIGSLPRLNFLRTHSGYSVLRSSFRWVSGRQTRRPT
jgi:hypothetical protein